jgi:hypothetical protein
MTRCFDALIGNGLLSSPDAACLVPEVAYFCDASRWPFTDHADSAKWPRNANFAGGDG